MQAEQQKHHEITESIAGRNQNQSIQSSEVQVKSKATWSMQPPSKPVRSESNDSIEAAQDQAQVNERSDHHQAVAPTTPGDKKHHSTINISDDAEESDEQSNDGDHDQKASTASPAEVHAIEEDPRDPLQAFGWDELTKRYHDMIKERNAEEEEILAEFNDLIQVSINAYDLTRRNADSMAVLRRMASSRECEGDRPQFQEVSGG